MGKREPPAEEGAPLWMCTYGDLMSLLLCFFIMLFAISIIAEVRFQALADALTQDFTGYSSATTTKAPSNKTITTPADSAAKSRRISALAGGQPTPGPLGDSPDVLAMRLTGETIRDGVICFELGSYDLTNQAKANLRMALPLLRGVPQKIRVIGYTAPIEESGIYQRDVELALNRALNVVDHFVELGLSQGAFEIVAEPGAAPNLNLLPAGMEPSLAGASVEIILLNQTSQALRE